MKIMWVVWRFPQKWEKDVAIKLIAAFETEAAGRKFIDGLCSPAEYELSDVKLFPKG